jgi:hypothetical protein
MTEVGLLSASLSYNVTFSRVQHSTEAVGRTVRPTMEKMMAFRSGSVDPHRVSSSFASVNRV